MCVSIDVGAPLLEGKSVVRLQQTELIGKSFRPVGFSQSNIDNCKGPLVG